MSGWSRPRIYDHWGNEIGGQGDNLYWGVGSGGASAYSHTHTINSDGGTEARPSNYTIKVWKRIN
jgi:hypothetical protein